jgi:hypothetical protein
VGLTASDTSAIQSQPELLVGGPGGAGANYFSGPGTEGPDGLHLCTEGAYDWGRFGPVSFSAADANLVKVIVTAAGCCRFVGGTGAYLNNGDVISNGVACSIGCAGAEALGWCKYAVDAFASPVHFVHPGGSSSNG